MPVDFSGKWEYVRGENLIEFMDKYDPALADRLRARGDKLLSMVMEVDQHGDRIKTTMWRGNTVRVQDLIIGEVDEHELPNGKNFKGTASWDGDKLVMHGMDEDGLNIKLIREIVHGEQVMTLCALGMSTKKFYKRI